MNIPVDLVGLAAGTLVTVSSLPKLAERLTRSAAGNATFCLPDLCRDGLQGVGNSLWVYVGLHSGLLSVTAFCGLNGLFMTALVVLNLRSGTWAQRIPNTRGNA